MIAPTAPGLTRPTYATGFYSPSSPCVSRAMFPSLWRGCLMAGCPSLGHSKDALDWSGRGNDGTPSSNGALTVVGDGGLAADFNSTWQYGYGNKDLWKGMSRLTLSIWFNTTSALTNRGMFTRWWSTASYAIRMGLAAGTVRFDINASASKNFETSGTYNDGEWHHAAIVYDGANFVSYVDNVSLNSQALTGDVSTAGPEQLAVGAFRTVNNPYSGHLDDWRMYNRALTRHELTLLSGVNGSESIGRGISYRMEEDTPFSNIAEAAGFPFQLYYASHGEV